METVKNKILILGGFGFMGKSLNAVLNKSNSFDIYNESRITGCDITNFEEVFDKINQIQPDIIINAAANVGSISYVTNFAADVIHTNSTMYINLYKAISQINKNILLINPISNCSYPGFIDIQNEEDWWNGRVHPSVESYGVSKKLGFVLSQCYERQYGIKTINLIIPNCYGPGDYTDEEKTHALNGIVMRMIKSQRNNEEEFTIWGTGEPIREWMYMEDVARVINKIICDKMYDLPNPINIGQRSGVSISETVDTIKEILKYQVSIIKDTTKQDGAPIKILGNDLFKKYFDNFEFTDYKIGIENTIKYYKEVL